MSYGDEQSQFTMNRAAYGDGPATMMASGGAGAGYQNDMNALSSIGAQIRPVFYAPPARVNVGFYGMQQQNPTFFGSVGTMLGMSSIPRSMYTSEYSANVAGDFGTRMAGGMVGGASTLLGSVGGFAAGKVMFGGSGLMGGVAGMVGGLGVSMGAMAAASYVQETVAQRQEMQNFLENTSYRYMAPGGASTDPRMGSGFSRAARRDVTDFIRKQEVSDPYLDFNDMNNILKQSTSQGLFNGTGSMDEFKTKFKDITDAVKVITKTLHQTLEEGVKTIRELKSIGIDPSQAKSVMAGVDTYAKMSGKTGAEMLGLGLQGADLFRGTGVQMGIGFQATMMNNSAIRAARDAGTLSNEAVMQAGGEEALAMRMTAGSLATAQSAMGRGYYAAFGNGGQFANQMMGGGGNFIDTIARAAGNVGNPAKLMEYQAFQSKHLSEIGGKFGGSGLQIGEMGLAVGQGTYLAGMTGASKEAGFRVVLQQMGKSEPEIEAMIGRMKNAKGEFNSTMASARQTLDKNLVEEAEQNFIFNRIGSKVKDGLSSAVDVLVRPLSKFHDDVAEGTTGWMERNIYGYDRVDTSPAAGLKFARGQRGTSRSGNMTADLDNLGSGGAVGGTTGAIVGAAAFVGLGIATGGVSLLGAAAVGAMAGVSPGIGLGGRITDALTVSSGEAILTSMQRMGAKTRMVESGGTLKSDDVVLDHNAWSGQMTVIKRSELEQKSSLADKHLTALSTAYVADKEGKLKNVSLKSLGSLAAQGKYFDISTVEGLVKATTGKSMDDVSSEELQALKVEYGSTKGFGKIISDYEKGLNPSVAASRNLAQQDASTSIKNMESAKESMFNEVNDRAAALGYKSRLSGQMSPGLAQAVASGDQRKIADSLMKDGIVAAGDNSQFESNKLAEVMMKSQSRVVWTQNAVDVQEKEKKYMAQSVVKGSIQEAQKSGKYNNDEIREIEGSTLEVSKAMLENPSELESALAKSGSNFKETILGGKAKDLVEIMKNLKGKSGTDNDLYAAIKGTTLESLGSSIIASGNKMGSSALISELSKASLTSGSEKSLSGTTSAGGAGLEGTSGSAIQTFDTQNRIAEQTLIAMTAMAARLQMK